MSVDETIDFVEASSRDLLRRDGRIRSMLVLRRLIKLKINVDEALIESIVWIYVGLTNDHIIVPRIYCSCKDYVIRVMSEKKRKSCIHLIAQKIAEDTGMYREVTVSLKDYYRIVNEVIRYGKSPTLRKILYGTKSQH